MGTVLTTQLGYTADTLPLISHSYAGGQITISEVAADIEYTPAYARDAVGEIERWLNSIRQVEAQVEEYTPCPNLRDEIVNMVTKIKFEIVCGPAALTYEYMKSTGILIVRARDEATVAWAVFRHILKSFRRFLDLLP